MCLIVWVGDGERNQSPTEIQADSCRLRHDEETAAGMKVHSTEELRLPLVREAAEELATSAR